MARFEDADGERFYVEATPAGYLWIDAVQCGDALIKLTPSMARALAEDLLKFADEQEKVK